MIYKAERFNAFETHLQAYIMQNFDEEPLKQILLPLPDGKAWVGNEVSCGVGMQRIDVMLTQEDEKNIYIKLIELKCGIPYENIVKYQIPWYIEWLSYYVIPNYYKKGKNIIVKPCIIAQKTDDEKIIEFISKTKINCPDTKAQIEPTEYIGFNIEDKNINFEKII